MAKAPAKKTTRKAPAKAPKKKDISTEERIKEAARKLFTQKGFAATRTRDIAEEAGINLALLNYYFRNKEKLFEIVMWENMQLFMGVVIQNLEGKDLSLEQMLEYVSNAYIEMLLKNPDLPFFVLGNIQSGAAPDQTGAANHNASGDFLDRVDNLRNTFFVRFEDEIRKGHVRNLHPLHFMANFMGLIIFPFLASRLLTHRFKISQEEFHKLMEQRKELIPGWMALMMGKR